MNRPLDVFTRSPMKASFRTAHGVASDRSESVAREIPLVAPRQDRFIRSTPPPSAVQARSGSRSPLSMLGAAFVAAFTWVRDRVQAAWHASTEWASDVTTWVVQKSSECFRFLTQLIEQDRTVADQRSRESQKALDEVRHIQNQQLRESLSGLDRQALEQSKRHRQVTATGQEAALRDQVRLGLTDDDDVLPPSE